jgi:hypothetical protein
VGGCELDLYGSGQGSLTDCCEYGNEYWDSIKDG